MHIKARKDRNKVRYGVGEKRMRVLTYRVSVQTHHLPVRTVTAMSELSKTARIWTCYLTV